MLVVMIFPFMPGKYDPLAIALSSFVQIYSGLGLITVIPASLWLLRNIKYPTNVVPNDSLLLKRRIIFKVYFWLNFVILLLVILFTGYGLSSTLGIAHFISLVYFSGKMLKKIIDPKSHRLLFSVCLPAALALLPLLLFVFQMVLDRPLTTMSRNRAIRNSRELVDEIERFNQSYGVYPHTLNAIHMDFSTGIAGIEKYHYTYDKSSYNIYFEQPRFFFDRVGTREFVVYNPHDRHLMMSHTVWHMIMEPYQLMNGQGWYESLETGHPHWKRFMFD